MLVFLRFPTMLLWNREITGYYFANEVDVRWWNISWSSPSLQPNKSSDFKLWKDLISSILSCRSGNLWKWKHEGHEKLWFVAIPHSKTILAQSHRFLKWWHIGFNADCQIWTPGPIYHTGHCRFTSRLHICFKLIFILSGPPEVLATFWLWHS